MNSGDLYKTSENQIGGSSAQHQDGNMGPYYSLRSQRGAPLRLNASCATGQEVDMQRLLETENLQQKLECESMKIIQVQARFNSDMQIKEKEYQESKAVRNRMQKQIVGLQNNGEHLAIELKKELQCREELVQKVNNCRDVSAVLAEHFGQVQKHLSNMQVAKDSLSAQYEVLNSRADQLRTDYEALMNRYTTERAHLRDLVKDERESRVREIHESNKQMQEAEERKSEVMTHLRDEQHENLRLLKVLEASKDEIGGLQRAAEELVKDHIGQVTNLNSALEHIRAENVNLLQVITECQKFEEEYNKLKPAFEDLKEERYEILQRLDTTESTLKTIEMEKAEAIQKLSAADNVIRNKENEKVLLVTQLENYQASIKAIEEKNVTILEHLETANGTIKKYEHDKEESLKQLEFVQASMNEIVSEKFEIMQQLDVAKSSIVDVTSEKSQLQEQLEGAKMKITEFENETAAIKKQLDAAESLMKKVEEDKVELSVQLSNAVTSIQVIDAEKVSLSKSLELAEAALMAKEDEKKCIQKCLDSAEMSIEKSNAEKDEILQQLAKAQSDIALIENEKEQIKDHLSSAKLLTATNEQEISDTMQKLETALAEVSDLNEKKSAISNMLVAAESVSDEYKKKSAEIFSNLEKAESELVVRGEENAMMTEQLKEAESQIAALEREKEDTLQSLKSSKSSLMTIEKEKATSVTSLEITKSTLQKMEQDKEELHRKFTLSEEAVYRMANENEDLVLKLSEANENLKTCENVILAKQDELDDYKMDCAKDMRKTYDSAKEFINQAEAQKAVDKKLLDERLKTVKGYELDLKTMEAEREALRSTCDALKLDLEMAVREREVFIQRAVEAEGESAKVKSADVDIKHKLATVEIALKEMEIAKVQAIEKVKLSESKFKAQKAKGEKEAKKAEAMKKEMDQLKVEFRGERKELEEDRTESRLELEALQATVVKLELEVQQFDSTKTELERKVEEAANKKVTERKYIARQIYKMNKHCKKLTHELYLANPSNYKDIVSVVATPYGTPVATPKSCLKSPVTVSSSPKTPKRVVFDGGVISDTSSTEPSDFEPKKKNSTSKVSRTPHKKAHLSKKDKLSVSSPRSISPKTNPFTLTAEPKVNPGKTAKRARMSESTVQMTDKGDPFAFDD